MDISLVDYSPKFKPLILDLFKKTFQKEMSKEFWDWRFEKNPFGKPIIKLAFYGEKLVGNYLVHPLQIVLGKRSIPILYSMTTMTDHDFTGRGISTNLANQVYDIGRTLGYKAVIAFVNKNSHYMFTKKLGFSDLNTMKELSINNLETTISQSTVQQISNFNEIPSDFFSTYLNSFKKFAIRRDSDYLNWRFLSNPENKYYCYKIVKNNEFCGYFILKNFNGIKCHIVDFLIKDDIDYYNAMINYSKIFCQKLNISNLTFWTNNNFFNNFLNQKKINVIPTQTYFVLKILNNSYDNINNFKNWYITMSDSDVF